MKGDFSRVGFDPDCHYTGVRHQQGRVLLDRDWNDAQEIEAHWRDAIAGDAFGRTVLAVPSDSSTAFEVMSAVADATGVHVTLAPGHAWAAGLDKSTVLPAASESALSHHLVHTAGAARHNKLGEPP